MVEVGVAVRVCGGDVADGVAGVAGVVAKQSGSTPKYAGYLVSSVGVRPNPPNLIGVCIISREKSSHSKVNQDQAKTQWAVPCALLDAEIN